MIAANTLNTCTEPFPSASAELRRFINHLIIIIIIIQTSQSVNQTVSQLASQSVSSQTSKCRRTYYCSRLSSRSSRSILTLYTNTQLKIRLQKIVLTIKDAFSHLKYGPPGHDINAMRCMYIICVVL